MFTNLIEKNGAVNACSFQQILFSAWMKLEVRSDIVDFACAKKNRV